MAGDEALAAQEHPQLAILLTVMQKSTTAAVVTTYLYISVVCLQSSAHQAEVRRLNQLLAALEAAAAGEARHRGRRLPYALAPCVLVDVTRRDRTMAVAAVWRVDQQILGLATFRPHMCGKGHAVREAA
jgi:hypothetical protein